MMKPINAELKQKLNVALKARRRDPESEIAWSDVKNALYIIFIEQGMDKIDALSYVSACMEDEIFAYGSLQDALDFIEEVIEDFLLD